MGKNKWSRTIDSAQIWKVSKTKMCEGDIQSENTVRDHISQNIGIKKQRKNISHNADDHILLILKIAKDVDPRSL